MKHLVTSQVRILHLILLSLLISGLVTSIAITASAGGIFIPDLGTVALGRGGAFVAKADDLTAMHYNPAGLSKSKGVNVLLGASLFDGNVDFLRMGTDQAADYLLIEPQPDESLLIQIDNPGVDWSNADSQLYEAPPFKSVSQETPIAVTAASLIVNWGDPFSIEGLSFAIGLLTPSANPKSKYPNDGPQRYSVREMNNMVLYPCMGVSFAFNRYIQIGAVFLSGMASVKKDFASRLQPAPRVTVLADGTFITDDYHNEDAGGDANFHISVKDWFMPTGTIGILSNPFDWLEIGATVKLPVHMEAKGTVDFTAPETDLSNAQLIKDGVTVKQHFPWIISAGVRYIHRLFDVEADFVWENWATYKEMGSDNRSSVDLYGSGLPKDELDMPDLNIPKNWKDTYSVRLGGDVQVWPENITVRLGGYYQSDAHQDNHDTFSVDFPNAQQFGTGLGLTWHAFDFIDISGAYLHAFQKQVLVKEGIVQQPGRPFEELPDPENPEENLQLMVGNVINNGQYDVNYNIFALSLEAHF
ncbi:MAG: hypothetical protein GY847_37255 [Proteobacteria bacterium]|nr:hypothetical protein [Pseudomonadota bacterium]